MTGKIVFENFKNKPMRSLLSTLLIAVPVTLMLSLVGLSHGMLEDSARRTRGVGADILVRPPGISIMSATGTNLSEKLVDFFAAQPHVKLALGVVNQPIQGVTLGVAGVDLKKFIAMSGGFDFVEGGLCREPNDVLVDEYYAAQYKLHVGGSMSMLNEQWRVSGIFQSGKLSHVVVPIEVLQKKVLAEHKVSQIYLTVDNPANARAVQDQLKNTSGLEGYQIFLLEEYMSAFSVDRVPGLKPFIGVIMGIGVIIGFAVVCLSMYMAVLQRTREIGMLKALGGSQAFILQIIVAEALLLGIGGSILGIIFSYGACWLIHFFVPASIQMVIVPSWWPIAGGITILGSALGALYPGLSAARHDPIEALAYE